MRILLRRSIFSIMLIAVVLLTTSCNLPGSAPEVPAGTHAWIDSPLNNSQLPLQRVSVISHSSDPKGISDVELSVSNAVIRTDSNQNPGQTLVVMAQPWDPPAPGKYTIQVRAKNTVGVWSNTAIVQVTILGAEVTETESPLPAGPFTPTWTPTTVFTLTPLSPTFTLIKNAFCRKGPDVSFPDVTGIQQGETVDILGVSEDGYWYFVYWKKFNAKCWVAAPTGQTNGSVQGIPVLVSPVTPTPPPEAPQPQPEPTAYKP